MLRKTHGLKVGNILETYETLVSPKVSDNKKGMMTQKASQKNAASHNDVYNHVLYKHHIHDKSGPSTFQFGATRDHHSRPHHRPSTENPHLGNISDRSSSLLNLSDSDKLRAEKYVTEPRNHFHELNARHHGSISPDAGDTEIDAKHMYQGVSESGQHSHADAVRKVADDIIKEKDSIINSQQLRINEMEAQFRLPAYVTDKDFLLKELQHQNELLKEQLSNMTCLNSKPNLSSSAGELEKHLCSLQYDYARYKKSSGKEMSLKDSIIADLKKELAERETTISKREKKLSERESELLKNQQELESCLTYMGCLPSLEEHKNNMKEIEELKESLQKGEKVNQERSNKLKERLNSIESKDREILELKKVLKDAHKCLEEIKSENRNLNEEVKKNEDFMEMRRLREAAEKLSREAETARKVYDLKLKQLEIKLSEKEREMNEMRGMMSNDEVTICALKQDIITMEGYIDTFRKEFNEVNLEKEMCHDELEKIQNERKYVHDMKGDEECRLFKQLMTDFNSTYEELKIIIRICKEKAENKEPSLDDLLGSKSSTDIFDKFGEGTTKEVLQKLHEQLKSTQRDVDFLKGELADLVAEDLARRLTCALQ